MKRWMGLLTLVCVLSLALPTDAWAKVHGVFRVVKGQVQVKSGKNGKIKRAKIGQKVFPKDTIITGKDSRAKVIMVDKNVINISPDSQLEIENYEFEPEKGKKNVLLNVLYGKVRSKVNQKYDGEKAKFQVKTKSAVAGVRGTDFLAGFNRQTQQSQVVTFEGEVSFGQPGPGGTIKNPVAVKVGQMADVTGNSPPAPPKSVPKQMLAKMDNESNADKAGAPGSDKREPASDKKDGDDKKKKDSDDKGDKAGSKKDDGDKKKADGGDKAAKKDSGDKKQGSSDKGKSDSAKGDNKSSRDTDKANNGKGGGDKSGGPKANAGKGGGAGGSSAGGGPGGPNSGEGGDDPKAEKSGPGGGENQAGNNQGGGSRDPSSVTPGADPATGGGENAGPDGPGDMAGKPGGDSGPGDIGPGDNMPPSPGGDGDEPIAGGDPVGGGGIMPPPPPPTDNIDIPDLPDFPSDIGDISGIPDIPDVPECDTCRDIIESGTARVLIQIQNGN